MKPSFTKLKVLTSAVFFFSFFLLSCSDDEDSRSKTGTFTMPLKVEGRTLSVGISESGDPFEVPMQNVDAEHQTFTHKAPSIPYIHVAMIGGGENLTNDACITGKNTIHFNFFTTQKSLLNRHNIFDFQLCDKSGKVKINFKSL